jgi:hypothetical protein
MENWMEYRLHTGKCLGDATKAELEAEAKWCFEQAKKDFIMAAKPKRARRAKGNTKPGEQHHEWVNNNS